jgi:glyoxylase-like metal-dependent hydrolase (beta-lactamase superfamily II)
MTTAVSATLPLPGGEAGASLRLHPLLCATALAPSGFFLGTATRAGSAAQVAVGALRRWVPYPIPAFLLEHPSAGPILIDTGLDPSVTARRRDNLGRFGALLFPGVEMPGGGVVGDLAARGVAPQEVKLVLMTHLHFDHASAMARFPQATFVVAAEEWWAANSPVLPVLRGYVRRHWEGALDVRLLHFDPPEAGPRAGFHRTLDLLGDGSVVAIPTPGETRGHLSFLLRLRDRQALVCGDAAYSMETLERRLTPFFVVSGGDYRRSLDQIRGFRDRAPDALILPSHDLGFWRALKPFYE